MKKSRLPRKLKKELKNWKCVIFNEEPTRFSNGFKYSLTLNGNKYTKWRMLKIK